MDMTKYSGETFLKFDDVANGPRRETIVDVGIGGFDKPVLEFESGEKLSLNATNTRVLVKFYGKDSRDWVGVTIELFPGQTEFKGAKQNSVLVRPISPGKPFKERHTPEPEKPPMNDDIPF